MSAVQASSFRVWVEKANEGGGEEKKNLKFKAFKKTVT